MLGLVAVGRRIGENMEDRYLSKAKRLDNGEWVEGVPFEIEGKQVILIKDNENLLRVNYLEENTWTSEIYAIEVDASTICQCTGLKDKNGKLIWENDIVNCLTEECCGYIGWNESEAGFYFNVLLEDGRFEEEHIYDYQDGIEVIGNIFDNPELLESEE